MKSKKKLLLMGVGVMGALAMGVGATSTFAWYQAQTTVGLAKSVETPAQSITADDPGYAADAVNLPIKIAIERVELKDSRGNSKQLELAHWYAENALSTAKDYEGNAIGTHAAGLYHAYYKGAGASSIVYRRATEASSLNTETVDPYAVYKIKVYVEFDDTDAEKPSYGTAGFWKDGATVKWCDEFGTSWTDSEVRTKLTGSKMSMTLARDTGSRAKFFTLTSGSSVPSTPAEGSATPAAVNNTDVASLASATSSATAVTIGTFGLYVEGLNNEGGIETVGEATDPTGNWKVTVAGVA